MGKNNSRNKKASDKDNNGNDYLTEDKQRDIWDYIEILGRPVSAFFTALAIALIGYFGQVALKDREEKINDRILVQQQEETKRAAQEQDYRLYTELMSRREVTESDLRKDMFTAILSDSSLTLFSSYPTTMFIIETLGFIFCSPVIDGTSP